MKIKEDGRLADIAHDPSRSSSKCVRGRTFLHPSTSTLGSRDSASTSTPGSRDTSSTSTFGTRDTASTSTLGTRHIASTSKLGTRDAASTSTCEGAIRCTHRRLHAGIPRCLDGTASGPWRFHTTKGLAGRWLVSVPVEAMTSCGPRRCFLAKAVPSGLTAIYTLHDLMRRHMCVFLKERRSARDHRVRLTRSSRRTWPDE
jgi:hypothetical protein